VDVEGHLYLAASDNHLVRLTIEGIDPQMANEEGITADDHFRLEYNVLSVNQPVEIVVPEECKEQAEVAGGMKYPVMDDATQVLNFGGMQTYKTQAQDEDVLAFYQEKLGAEGWIFDAARSVSGKTGHIWLFTRDDQELQVMTGKKGGKTVVSLLESEVTTEEEQVVAQEESLPLMPDAFDDLSLSTSQIYRTHASTAEILAFYQDELGARGWHYDPEATQLDEQGTMWLFTGEDGQSIRILTASKDGETFVTVSKIVENP
jgi:hypothetical protein